MISDPQFWNRFSVAVHQDDLEKQLITQDPKHSYVSSSSPIISPAQSPSPLGSPTSQTHHHPPGYPPMVQLSSVRLSIMSTPLSPLSLSTPSSSKTTDPKSPKNKKAQKHRSRSHLQKTPSTRPLLRPSIPDPSQPPTTTTTTSTSGIHVEDPLGGGGPLPASPSRPFFRGGPNLSTLSLSHLSGRPSSRFKFVTTITADASHRDSWLVRQKKKERQRTWLCCAFWGVLLALVAATVTTVLVLRHNGVILQ